MPNFAANLHWLFTELDFMDRFAAASIAGFKGVECLFPYDHVASDVAAKLADHGLSQALINAPPGDWVRGERGLGCLPDRQDEFRKGLKKSVCYAEAIGCKRIHAMAGIAPDGADPERLQDVFIDNLSFAAALAGETGIRVMIEPINRIDMPGYYLSRPDQAAVIIEAVASPHLRMQFDIYHVGMEGLDISGQIERHFPVIDHFQVARIPGRGEPIGGDVDYRALFGMIDELGFQGWIGCEYRPEGRTEDGLEWIQEYGFSYLAMP